jgi:hypothetical protein
MWRRAETKEFNVDLKNRRILTACLLLALVVFGTTGCDMIGSSDTAPIDPGAGDTLVALDASGGIEDGVLAVEGTATVPDGAMLSYVVMPIAEDGALIQGVQAHSVTYVRNEEFSFEVPIAEWEGDKLNVWVAFYTTITDTTPGGVTIEQPDEVIQLYGETGERIEGETRQLGEVTAVEAAFTIDR